MNDVAALRQSGKEIAWEMAVRKKALVRALITPVKP